MCNPFVGFAMGVTFQILLFFWILAFRPQCFPFLSSLDLSILDSLFVCLCVKPLLDEVLSFGGEILIFLTKSNFNFML